MQEQIGQIYPKENATTIEFVRAHPSASSVIGVDEQQTSERAHTHIHTTSGVEQKQAFDNV